MAVAVELVAVVVVVMEVFSIHAEVAVVVAELIVHQQ
jgi:hypothetical protein